MGLDTFEVVFSANRQPPNKIPNSLKSEIIPPPPHGPSIRGWHTEAQTTADRIPKPNISLGGGEEETKENGDDK